MPNGDNEEDKDEVEDVIHVVDNVSKSLSTGRLPAKTIDVSCLMDLLDVSWNCLVCIAKYRESDR